MHMHMHRNRETASHCEPLTICLPIFSTSESGADFTYSHLFLFFVGVLHEMQRCICFAAAFCGQFGKHTLGSTGNEGKKTGAVTNAVDRYTIVQSELEDDRFRFCLTMRVLKCSEQSVP